MRAAGLILGLIFGLAACPAVLAQGAPAPAGAAIRTEPFPDVPTDHWAYQAVEQLRKQGILRGYPAEAPRRPESKKPRAVRKRPTA